MRLSNSLFATGFRKKMENVPFLLRSKRTKIGHVIEIRKVLRETLIKIAMEENSATKRAISKKRKFKEVNI